MACSVYKVFTRERGTYQDVNGIQEYFRDYINNNLQLIIDCVSTNTALKVVKRDASGNFAAGTITANLTGDVTGNVSGNTTGDVIGGLTGNVTGNCSGSSGSCTGNAATATIADAAKGDMRFQQCGNFAILKNYSLSANSYTEILRLNRNLLSGKKLVLKKITVELTQANLRLEIWNGGSSKYNTSEALLIDEDTDTVISSTPGNNSVVIILRNTSTTFARTIAGTESCWIELAIENV
jgi:hypothetical protein